MPRLRRVVLDVLKPHQPSAPDLAAAIAGLGQDHRVEIDVEEIDENTVTTSIRVEGEALDLARIESVIKEMGGAVHSIDQVEVWGDEAPRSS